MKSTFYFLIKPKAKRYNNTKKIGDKELILNSEIFDHKYISREAVVVGLPAEFETEIKEGYEIIVHHNVFRRWHNARGQEKNSSNFISEDLYKDFYQSFFLNLFVILYNIKNHSIWLLQHKKRSNIGKRIRLEYKKFLKIVLDFCS